MINKAYSLTLAAFALLVSIALSACGGAEGVDSVPPTVEINGAEAANSTMLVTFTFSEAITESSITADDVTVTGATKAASVTKVDSTHWTLVITPTGGPVTVTLGTNKFEDLAHNANAESASYTRPILNFAETGAKGYGFEDLVSAEIVDDPVTTNVGNRVLKLVKNQGSKAWAGANIKKFGTQDVPMLPVFDLTSSKVVTMRSYTDAAIGTPVSLKLIASGGGSMTAEAKTSKQNAWETLTFDFGTRTSGTYSAAAEYNQAAIFPSWTEKSDKTGSVLSAEKTFYFDDLTYTQALTPLVSAATPPDRLGTNVFSVYGDKYGAVSASFELWGAQTAASEIGQSDKIKKLANFNYIGVPLNQTKDLSLFDGLHIDYWTTNVAQLSLTLISKNGNAASVEKAKTITSIAGWNSIDLDLVKDFGTPLDLANVIQIKLANGPTAPELTGGNLFVDNIYFYKDVFTGTFASDYVAGKSKEGGTTDFYMDWDGAYANGANPEQWWAGFSGPGAENPNFGAVWGLSSNAKPGWMGWSINAPKNRTLDLAGYANMEIYLWGASELFKNRTPTITYKLAASAIGNCVPAMQATLSANSAVPKKYTVSLALSNWTMDWANGCGKSKAEILASVATVHVQLVGESLQFVNGGPLYANGLNIGTITFK